jgi:hypothetical protein
LNQHRHTGWLVTVAAVLALSPALGQENTARFATDSRVIAFADVHGAYDELIELLQAAGIVDSALAWSAGSAHVVSLGDLLDRGVDTRAVLDLVMRLQREASAAGGRLHVVLGNHELMTLLGDWRYVAPGDYESFAAEESQETRDAAYAQFSAGAGGDSAATLAQFTDRFPRGFFARQAAFAADGRYGAWLRSLPAVVVVNDTAYVHGGLSPVVAEHGIAINQRVRSALDRYFPLRDRLVERGALPPFDRQRDGVRPPGAQADAERDELAELAAAPELGPDGPLWYRGSVYCKPMLEEPTLDAALARLEAARAVVGHTPTADGRPHALYDGKLVMLDTGMNADYYRGRPSALVAENGALTVQYAAPSATAALDNGRVVAYGRTAAALKSALERGAVQSVQRARAGEPWAIVVQDGDATIEAAFYPSSANGAGNAELAAAALDELLGTDLVPLTVARTIEDQAGALQLRYPGAMSERERVERRLPFSGWCPIEPQLGLMRVFDVLTMNRARNSGTALFGNELTDLLLIDHALAFDTSTTVPATVRALPIPEALTIALRALDEQRLTSALGEWLSAREIRALLVRRDRLLGAAR